jgi:hypothetical protein
MHHVFDETPEEALKLQFAGEGVTRISHAIYNTNVGATNPIEIREQYNTSQYRQRGFQVGSRMTAEKEPDFYYVQPGHAISPQADKGGRFKVRSIHHMLLSIVHGIYDSQSRKQIQEWTPDMEMDKK